MTTHVQRVAHRGGARLWPENTLTAFRNVLTLPIDAVELDVQMSRDGHAVVFHDETMDRLTNSTGNMLDMDFADLSLLNVAARFPGGWPEVLHMPTLHEALVTLRGKAQAYIEIKVSRRDGVYGRYPGIVEAVVDNIRAVQMLDKALIISFDWSVLPQVRVLEPRLQTAAIVSKSVWEPGREPATDAFTRLVEQVRALGASWISIDHRLFFPAMSEIVHAHGLRLNLWTVDDREELQQFATAGVDSLTSNRPDLFAEL